MWLAVIVAGILLSRGLAIPVAQELNTDESQMLAQVLGYRQSMVPWLSVDGTSGGPLNPWFVMLAQSVGIPYGYVGIHLLAALSLSGTLVAGFFSARRAFGPRAAMAGTVFTAVWLACQQSPDFVHYSSELFPVMLLSLAWILLQGRTGGKLGAAFLLGMVPWAKLQVAPVAGVIGAWMVAGTLFPGRNETMRPMVSRIAEALTIILAALLPSVLMLALVASGGALMDMYQSYVLGNLEYAGASDLAGFLRHLAACLFTSNVAPLLLAVLLGGTVAILRGRWRPHPRLWRSPEALGGIVLLASLFVCLRPWTGFDHYLLILVPSLQFLSAAVAAALLTGVELTPRMVRRIGVALGCFGVAVGCVVLLRVDSLMEKIHKRMAMLDGSPSEAKIIRDHVRNTLGAKGPIVVWGFEPSIYVEDRRPAGTRHVETSFLYYKTPQGAFMRDSFMRDIRNSKPEIIL